LQRTYQKYVTNFFEDSFGKNSLQLHYSTNINNAVEATHKFMKKIYKKMDLKFYDILNGGIYAVDTRKKLWAILDYMEYVMNILKIN